MTSADPRTINADARTINADALLTRLEADVARHESNLLRTLRTLAELANEALEPDCQELFPVDMASRLVCSVKAHRVRLHDARALVKTVKNSASL